MVKILDLKQHPQNPNTHPAEQITELGNSLEQFDQVKNIVVWQGQVIAGNGLLEAAQKQGRDAIEVQDVSDWPEEKAIKFMVADNRLAELGVMDNDLLADLLAEVDEPLDIPGVDENYLDELFDDEKKEEKPVLKILKAGNIEELVPTKEELEVLQGRKILVEFSGGKDSTAVCVWINHFLPKAKKELCFSEMGADFVGFDIYLKETARYLNIDLTILRSKKSIIDTFLSRKRWPHFSNPYCHDILHSTLGNHYTQYKPEEIVIMRGGRAQERGGQSGKLRKTRFITIKNKPEYIFFQPLYFASKDTAENILNDINLKIWEGYSYGLQRTACRCCPGQRPIAYAAMRENYPDVWAELLALEQVMGEFAWGKHTDGRHWSFKEMADLGQKHFDDGSYLKRFTMY